MSTVRRFGPDDWEAARAARLASVRESFGERSEFYREQSTIEEAAWRAVLTEHARFGAFVGSEPVGTACWRPDPDGDGLLYGMWVHAAHRGTGLADLLVDSVVAVARERGGRTLRLKVEPRNARARAFYRRCGFGEEEATGGLVVMVRELG